MGEKPTNTPIIHHHHHISVMELGHLLACSGLTCPEVSSKVCHDSFCQSGSSVSSRSVICYEAFCLHVVSIFSCIPVLCPKLELFLTPSQFVSSDVTRHNMPIHNILSTAPQLSISQKALGMLPEDGNVMLKHVGAIIHHL
jgi:hypothetical protein